jgi:hypothetical protein
VIQNISKVTRPNSREHDVCDLNNALRSFFSNFKNHLRVILILEGWPSACKYRPSFSYQSCARRNCNSRCHNIKTSIEENDLATSELSMPNFSRVPLDKKEVFTRLCKDGFKCLCIVRHPVAFSTMVPHTDKFGDIIILILWVRSTDNTSSVVQETWSLRGFRYIPLNKLSVWIRTMIYVPLSPGDNSLVSSSKNRCTVDNADRNRNVDQLGVVDYKGTGQRSVARF